MANLLPERRSNSVLKTKKERLYLVLIGLLALAIICVVITAFAGKGAADAPASPEAAEPQIPTTKVVYKEVEKLVEVEKEISAEILQDGLNDMGILITEEYYFTEVVSFSSIKNLLKTDIKLPFTESSYLASYDGTVSAGIDFSAISVAKDDSAYRITVYLPKSEIQGVTIDPNSFELYSEKVGFGNPLSVEDFNQSLTTLEETAKTKAVEKGLLERADENARTVISNFISGLADPALYSLEFIGG